VKHYAGLDLSMETTHVCVVDADGRKIGAQYVDSTPETIAAALEQYGPIERAVIETGRMAPSIAPGLRELGVAIVCIDARQARQSLKAMKANKTDPHDAAGLAQLARTGFYKEVHVKSPAAHGVRSVITARGHLVEARVRLDNTIRGLRATFGIRLGIGQGERFLARMQVAASVPGLGEAAASLLRTRERLVLEVGLLDRQLKAISTASPVCQALMSIPGVDVQTSAAFAAAVDDASRFKRSRTAAAYFGLVPRRHQSGELDWTGRITKQGTAPFVSCSTKRPTRS
jgi:transposase